MKKIIIIDDDPAILDSTSLIFGEGDYSMQLYPNGDAILSGEYEMPDVFIIDKQLSGVDGLTLCQYIKTQEASKHVPVIIMSASPLAEKLSIMAGADAFIEKPYSLKTLREAVRRLCS